MDSTKNSKPLTMQLYWVLLPQQKKVQGTLPSLSLVERVLLLDRTGTGIDFVVLHLLMFFWHMETWHADLLPVEGSRFPFSVFIL